MKGGDSNSAVNLDRLHLQKIQSNEKRWEVPLRAGVNRQPLLSA
ncbi:MAG: hypothetical protein JWQ79_4155 [Mucilaginibacter sp.]|nr:hypothetical protein [Mucilaginibacter sp.]